jgi:hypothetical protein
VRETADWSSRLSTHDSVVSLKVTVIDTDIVAIDDIPWTQSMNAQAVLEAAYETREDPGYGFSLAYYGSSLGYLVEEFENIGDQANLYWQFFVNGEVSTQGIDRVTLDPGDAVSFQYSYFPHGEGSGEPQLAAKQIRKGRAR